MAVGPEAVASVGPKAAVALGDWAVAAEKAEAPVWRSGRWRSWGVFFVSGFFHAS
jgi:hypothetical protein